MLAAAALVLAVSAFHGCVAVHDWAPAGEDQDGGTCNLHWKATIVNNCRQVLEVEVKLYFKDEDEQIIFVDDGNMIVLYPNEKSTDSIGYTSTSCENAKQVYSVEVIPFARGVKI